MTFTYDDLYAGARRTFTAEQVQSAQVLLDARAPERFRGAVETVDPVAGRIPGALNMPSTSLLTPGGAILDDPGLAALLQPAGIGPSTDVGVYCGSGITAAVVVAALTAVGVDAALFPGSWSEWSSDPARPVAVG